MNRIEGFAQPEKRCITPLHCAAESIGPAPQDDLLAQAEFLDKGAITIVIGLGDVLQQTASLSNHLEQAAPGGVILLVVLKVFGQVKDSRGEDGHLYFNRAGVFAVSLVVCYDAFTVYCFRVRHFSFLCSPLHAGQQALNAANNAH
jgi:hypothetical protein